MNETEARSLLFQAIQEGKMNTVIRCAHEILQHPVIITDAGFHKLTEVFPAEPTGDQKWDCYLYRDGLDLTTLKAFLERDNVQLLQQPLIVYFDKGYFADSPQLCAPVVSGGKIRGYVTILCPHSAYSPELTGLLKITAEAVSIVLRNRTPRFTHSNNMQQAFIDALFSGSLNQEGQAEHWARELRLDLQPGYILMAISSREHSAGAFHDYLASILANARLPLLVSQRNDTLYLLIHSQSCPEYNSRCVQEVCDMAVQFDYICGVSQDFASLADLDSGRMQAEYAMRLRLPASAGNSVRYFRSLALYIILQTAAEILHEKNCIHPAIPFLEEYDRTYAAEYLKTLREYLRNSCRSSETCESIHIHRNTLNYRINKIEHLAGIDLGSEYTRTHLSLSFMLLEK